MMTEAVLLLIVIALVGLVAFMDWNNRKERKSLLNAILSKTTEDMVNLELADKTKIDVKNDEEDNLPDFTEVEGMSDDEYVDMITKKE